MWPINPIEYKYSRKSFTSQLYASECVGLHSYSQLGSWHRSASEGPIVLLCRELNVVLEWIMPVNTEKISQQTNIRWWPHNPSSTFGHHRSCRCNDWKFQVHRHSFKNCYPKWSVTFSYKQRLPREAEDPKDPDGGNDGGNDDKRTSTVNIARIGVDRDIFVGVSRGCDAAIARNIPLKYRRALWTCLWDEECLQTNWATLLTFGTWRTRLWSRREVSGQTTPLGELSWDWMAYVPERRDMCVEKLGEQEWRVCAGQAGVFEKDISVLYRNFHGAKGVSQWGSIDRWRLR